MIAIRDVRKSFGSNLVLDGISLDVVQGEVVCVIGPSGSGKSTLLRCVNGLESYDDGEIIVAGRRPQDVSQHHSPPQSPSRNSAQGRITTPSTSRRRRSRLSIMDQ